MDRRGPMTHEEKRLFVRREEILRNGVPPEMKS